MRALFILLVCICLPSCGTCYTLAVLAGFYQEREARAEAEYNAHELRIIPMNRGYNPTN
jgi:hypothetical protein